MPFKQGWRLCLCEICDCGGHKCIIDRSNVDGYKGINSEYTNAYFPKDADAVQSCKPKNTFMMSTDPIDNLTTHRKDFIPFDTGRPEMIKYPNEIVPEGDIDLNSTYAIDFPRHILNPPKLCLPKIKKGFVGPFDAKTDYQDNFINHHPCRLKQIIPINCFHPSKDPLADLTTSRESYVIHDLNCRAKIKNPNMSPQKNFWYTNDPMAKTTDYRDNYFPKKVTPCPAVLLKTSSANWKHAENLCGHQFYDALPGTYPIRKMKKYKEFFPGGFRAT